VTISEHRKSCAQAGAEKHKNGERGMESIQSIVDRLVKRYQIPKRTDKSKIYQRWNAIVGGTIAQHTRVVDLQGGVLHVEVNSAPLLHELSTYYSQDILDSVREKEEFSFIQEIRFRVGSF